MNKKQRLKRAFTITELVIVIAVIAVLAAVLIPTFASVVKSANKSADEQYLKNINITLADYTASNGKPAADYPEMMKALAADGLCDPANPYLLAKKLKEDDVRMVWYPNTDKVQLIDTSRETLLWQTGATRGMGNYALVNTVFVDDKGKEEEGLTGAGCYVLCVAGDKSCEAAAQLYYDFYETYKGDAKQFASNNKYTEYVNKMGDKAWANSIVAAIKNAQVGYVHDDKIEEQIKDDLGSATDTTLDLTDKGSEGVLAALATLSSMATDSVEKEKLAGKTVTLNVPDSLKENGEGVDMSNVTLASIGDSYRKEANIQNGNPESTVSVDFGDIKLKDVNVPKGFVSSGAAFQTASDSGHAKDGYAFTYGMFGSIIAAPGDEVVIENLHITGVNMDFSNSTETINGKKVETFADNAGVIAGYTQGNVTFKNITIDGKYDGHEKGLIKGYDAIAGVVGRAYAAVGDNDKDRKPSTLKLEKVKVSNLSIEGERRASGFVGFTSKTDGTMKVEITDCELNNVDIKATRNDEAKTIYQCWATVFADSGLASKDSIKVTGCTLTKVTTTVNFQGKTADNDLDDALKSTKYVRKDKLYLVGKTGVTITNLTIDGTAYYKDKTAQVEAGNEIK